LSSRALQLVLGSQSTYNGFGMPIPQSVYLRLSEAEFEERGAKLYGSLESCTLCARRCEVDRTQGEHGSCRSGTELTISNIFPHFGEEPPLRGRGGSGTIFLANCNLRCVFCQNWELSHLGAGSRMREEELAHMMLHLQERGCHNINFVTPTHFAPQLVRAVKLAAWGGVVGHPLNTISPGQGLKIPLVWNCGGYESVDALKLLEGIVDIYMPDIKYGDQAAARRFSAAPDYFEVAKAAVSEMHRQVGDLVIEDGIAVRGVLIRHLVLPNRLAGSEKVLDFIARLSHESYVNIMDQYYPCYKASDYPELSRRITQEEYDEVIELALDLGLHRGFLREKALLR
jgi:putative pyruvate formate lyase activating enzyme